MTIAAVHLQRSIAAMTIALHKAVEQKDARTSPYRMTEREVQYQIKLAGSAAAQPAETSVPVTFDVTFLADTGAQRDSSLNVPQIRVGWEFRTAPPGLIAYAHATDWDYDDLGAVQGVTMTLGVYAPLQATDSAPFDGVCHLSFQGYGAPIDNDTDDSPGTDIDTED